MTSSPLITLSHCRRDTEAKAFSENALYMEICASHLSKCTLEFYTLSGLRAGVLLQRTTCHSTNLPNNRIGFAK